MIYIGGAKKFYGLNVFIDDDKGSDHLMINIISHDKKIISLNRKDTNDLIALLDKALREPINDEL